MDNYLIHSDTLHRISNFKWHLKISGVILFLEQDEIFEKINNICLRTLAQCRKVVSRWLGLPAMEKDGFSQSRRPAIM